MELTSLPLPLLYSTSVSPGRVPLIRRIELLMLVVFLSVDVGSAMAQHDPVRLNAANVDEGVRLEWTFPSGFLCNGIQIYHAIDTHHFARIGEVPGICGSTDEEMSYTFIHEDPVKNRQNYYKFRLGNNGLSAVICHRVDHFGQDGYTILSQPGSKSMEIRFEPWGNPPYTIRVYSMEGTLQHEGSGTSGRFIINLPSMKAGLYVFGITGAATGIQRRGKFFIR